MDLRYHVAALREVRLLVSGAQSAHGVRAGAATHRGKGASRDLIDVLLVASVVFVPAIAAVAAVIVVIKQVHTVVQITEERMQLIATTLRSAESACVSIVINPVVLISLIVIATSFLGVAVLNQKETNSKRSLLIGGIAYRRSRRCFDARSASTRS